MFSESQRYMVFDYETFSTADLGEVGASEYARHPSTQIICSGFRIGTRATLRTAPTGLWIPEQSLRTEDFPQFLAALRNPDIILVAQNAFFEQMITSFCFAPKFMASKLKELQGIPLERWLCTAATARASGHSGKLEIMGEQLNLAQKKDGEGHRQMLKVSKPKRETKLNWHDRHNNFSDISRTAEYCVQDVATEVEAFLTLPEMPDAVRASWLRNMKRNHLGVLVDRDLVSGALEMIEMDMAELLEELAALTEGRVKTARQVAAYKKELERYGVELPNLQADTIRDFDASNLAPIPKRLIEIRKIMGRSSVSKYAAFEARSRTDGRSRDNTMFWGAHTGRESGSGIQMQNLFKTTIKPARLNRGIELLREKDLWGVMGEFEGPERIELLASALRGCIIAPEGKHLFVGDFATIEVRVLFWLARHTEGLAALAAGRPLYSEQAADIFGGSAEVIEEGSKAGDKKYYLQRQLGKQIVLGGGYGIGINGEKFLATCHKYDMKDVDLPLAQKCVRAYRDRHRPIPQFWSDLDAVVARAMARPGSVFQLGLLQFRRTPGGPLKIRLPSGRMLTVNNPHYRTKQGAWGESREFNYSGLHPQTKKPATLTSWGGKFAEWVTQATSFCLLDAAYERLAADGRYTSVLGVHDEIVAEGEAGAPLEPFERLMALTPPWATGLPLKVEAWAAPRYRK